MKEYLTQRLNNFTLAELEGGLQRVNSLISTLPSAKSIKAALEIHKEMARENLLSEYTDVSPDSKGMFSGDSVLDMTVYSIRMGYGDGAITYDDLLQAKGNGDEKVYISAYTDFFNKYKEILLFSLKYTKDKLEKSIAEAKDEVKQVNKRIDNGSLRGKVAHGLMHIYKNFNEQKTKYRLDVPDIASKYSDGDKQMAFLKRNGVTSSIPEIITNSFHINLSRPSSVGSSNSTFELRFYSPGELFAKSEKWIRSLLRWCADETPTGKVGFELRCKLPITDISGNPFLGYQQAVLRLAAERYFSEHGFTNFLPMVIDSDTAREIGLIIKEKDNVNAIPLLCSSQGRPEYKDYYFLNDTTFFEKYPEQSAKLTKELNKLNLAHIPDKNISNEIRDNHMPSEENDIMDLIYRISTMSTFNAAGDAETGFSDETLAAIADQSTTIIAKQYEERGFAGSIYGLVLKAGELAMSASKSLCETMKWEPYKPIMTEDILSGKYSMSNNAGVEEEFSPYEEEDYDSEYEN